MTLFWAAAVAMVALALAFLLPPLLRRRVTAPDARAAANASIYREQLDELAAELRRGALTPEEYVSASREVERRVVAEHGAGGPVPAEHRPPRAAALAVVLLLPLAAGVGYWQLGNPGAVSAVANEAGHMVSRAQVEELVEKLAARMEQTPDDAEGWMLLGRSLNVLGRHERAAKAYERAVKASPQDANLLADYADALAMASGGKLAGEPYAIVKRALAIDPEHIKSLALAGTAEFEARNYAAAIAYWERLQKIVPSQTEFARSVGESIAEARSLAGGALAQAPAASPAQAKAPAKDAAKAAATAKEALQGTVSIEPSLAAKLAPGDTVFVLARPASGARMPLAVARTTVSELPYRFTLDDSMAMAPGATISSHEKILVAARVSRSGNAIPQKGDIEGTSEPVAPGARGIRVVLSRVVD